MTTGRLRSNTTGTVTKLERPLRPPTTRIEKRVLAVLASEGPLPFDALVGRVADDLYRDELRHGGWAAEIGVIGSGAFRAGVERAMEQATDVLWTVESRAR